MLPKVSRLRPEGKGLTGLGHYRMWTQWGGEEGKSVKDQLVGSEWGWQPQITHLRILQITKQGRQQGQMRTFQDGKYLDTFEDRKTSP